MKFAREALIARIDELQAEARQAHEERFAPRKAAWDKAVANYREKSAPQLASELRALANRARGSKPITGGDISKATNEHCFESPRDPGERYGTMYEEPKVTPFKPDARLASLRRLLVDLKDEVVTTRDLQALGFEPKLFISAVV